MATYDELVSGVSVVTEIPNTPNITLASTTNPYTELHTPFVDENVSLPLDITVHGKGVIQPGRPNELNFVVSWEGSLKDGFSIGCHIGAGTKFTEEGATNILADAIRKITRDKESRKTLDRSCYLASLDFVILDHKVRTHPQSDIAASAVATTFKALYLGSDLPKTKTQPYFRGHGGTIVAATPRPSIAASLGKTTGKGKRRSYVTVAKNEGSFRLAKQDSEMKGHMNEVASSPNYALYSLPCSLKWRCNDVDTMIREGDPDAEAKNERSLAGRGTFTNFLGLGLNEAERPKLPTSSRKSKKHLLASPQDLQVPSSSTASSRPSSNPSSRCRSHSRSPSTSAHSRRVAISARQDRQIARAAPTSLQVPDDGNNFGALNVSPSHSAANRPPDAAGLSASFIGTQSQRYHPGDGSQPDEDAARRQYMPDFEDWEITAVGDDVTGTLTVDRNSTFGLSQPSNSLKLHAPELASGMDESYRQYPQYGDTGSSVHRPARGMQAPYFGTTHQPLGSTSYGSHYNPHGQELQGFQRLPNQTHHDRASAAPSQSPVHEQPPASLDVNAQMTSKQGYYDPRSDDSNKIPTGKMYYSGWQYPTEDG